jgi:hypothetical protein
MINNPMRNNNNNNNSFFASPTKLNNNVVNNNNNVSGVNSLNPNITIHSRVLYTEPNRKYN